MVMGQAAVYLRISQDRTGLQSGIQRQQVKANSTVARSRMRSRTASSATRSRIG